MPAAVRPVLFLNVDGVLNTTRTWGAWMKLGHPHALEGHLVRKVAQLVARTNARVVLSSTWRRSSAGLSGTALAFEYQGWVNARRIVINQTPVLPGMPRGDEIAMWLRLADHTGPVAILDDESDMGSLLPCLVRTDSSVGVSDANIATAELLLKSRS